MKSSTKRLVSSVLAASMALSNVAVNTTFVGAAEGNDTVASGSAVSTASGFTGQATYTAADANAANPAGIGGNGSADLPDEVELGAGVYAVNGGSAFAAKANAYTFSDGVTYDAEFQIGKGNEAVTADATSVSLPVEKGLKLEVGGAGTAKIYTGIGSSGVLSLDLLVIDSTGAVISKATVTKDDSTSVFSVAEISLPAAGTYYVINPAKQASWNFAAIALDIAADSTPSTETTTEATTDAVETTTEATTEATTETPAASGFTGQATVLASDANAANPAGIGGNGSADLPEEVDLGSGVFAVNGGSAFAAKTSAYTFEDGKAFDSEFQIGKGNEAVTADATSVTLPVEKGLKFEVGGKGTAKIYTGIGSSGVLSLDLLVIDSTGAVVSKATVTKDDSTSVLSVPTIEFPAAGTYYVINPAKQASWNLAAIDLDIEAHSTPVTETTTEATTEATTEESTETTTEFVPSADTMYVKASVEGDSDTIGLDKIGQTVNVDFSLINNPGFNNYTFFIKYNPNVVKAVAVNEPANYDYTGYVIYESVYKGNVEQNPAYDADTVNAQINTVPLAEDSDYADVNADGAKTQAELGKVKLAYVYDGKDASGNLLEINGDGKLLSITFDVLAEGDAEIEVVGTNAFQPSPVNKDKTITFGSYPSTIKVAKEETTTTTETTTEPTTQATTEPTSQATTEPTSQATTEPTSQATTEPTTEATTQAPTVTETTTVITSTDATTETTTSDETEETTKKRSGGGGGGGGSSSPIAATGSSKTTTEASDTEDTTKATRTTEYATEATTEYVPSNNTLFNDIADKPWAETAINSLAELGIINGVGNGQFAPNANCKRADFAIMLVNVLGLTGAATDNFDDVASGKYYYNAVGLAKEAGVVNGYGDGNFGPENYCTRAELMVMVTNALSVAGIDTTANNAAVDKFSDANEIPSWAVPYVAYLVEAGIVSGSNNKINANVNITRAEVAVIMYNVVETVTDLNDEAVEEIEEYAEEVEEEAEEEAAEETEESTEEAEAEADAEAVAE